MTGRREALRDSSLRNPGESARTLNELLLSVYRRLEALERRQYVDVEVMSDATGLIGQLVLAAPPWPVRAVYIAKIFDLTANATTGIWARTVDMDAWLQTSVGIMLPATLMPAANRRYALTFEVRG